MVHKYVFKSKKCYFFKNTLMIYPWLKLRKWPSQKTFINIKKERTPQVCVHFTKEPILPPPLTTHIIFLFFSFFKWCRCSYILFFIITSIMAHCRSRLCVKLSLKTQAHFRDSKTCTERQLMHAVWPKLKPNEAHTQQGSSSLANCLQVSSL